MKKIPKASILQKKGRKFWYIRYKVLEGDTDTQHETTSKTLITEKNRTYMEEVFLPGWVEAKEAKLNHNAVQTKVLSYYADLYIDTCKNKRDQYSMEKRTNRIMEKFGERKIDTITELEIEMWINALTNQITGKDLAKATRKKYKTTFNKIFMLAKKDKAIEINFIDEIEIRGAKKDKNATNPFNAKEVHLLLEKSKDTEYGKLLHLYLGLIFNQGLSPSEAIALQVKDVSFDSNRNVHILSINKSLVKNIIGAPKNGYRERDIILRQQTMKYVNILLEQAKSKNSVWLFSNDVGSRLSDIEDIRGTDVLHDKKTGGLVHNRSKWYKLLYDLGLEFRPLKNCRHTFTMAMLDSNGTKITSLANMLGHSSTHMIVNHYAKSIQGKAMEINEASVLY